MADDVIEVGENGGVWPPISSFIRRATATGATFNSSVVPLAGGGQTGASRLVGGSPGYNTFLNPANGGDSVQLPDAIAPSVVIAFCNAGATVWNRLLAVFAREGTLDSINGLSNATQFDAIGQNAGAPALIICICAVDGQWECNLTQD